MSDPRLTVVDAGRMAYDACLDLQHELHARVVAGQADGYLVLVEHPPVLTLGKHADPGHLLLAAADLAARGIAVVRTDRGGEVTAHMPGQLVVYPILGLTPFGLGPRRLITLLEGAVIQALASFGVVGATDPDHPGVWVGAAKVAAVGVRIKDRVSMHGLALNVADDLDLFAAIVPCGIKGRGVTSLSRLAGRPVSLEDVKPLVVAAIASGLRLSECPPACNDKRDSLQFEI